MNASAETKDPYMPEPVNLDALIPREDFLASEGPNAGAQGKAEVSRTDLLPGESFSLTLRKPDFQRETAAWTPESIRDFVQAFIEGDLIPSVICWQSPARLSFVIDGAHRLSAVIAWLRDDYGDGDDSIKFYNNNIPEQQRRIAQQTRQLIDKSVGSYKELRAETNNPGSNPKLTEKARALAHSKIPLLWIKGEDSTKAEKAFLTINRAAVQIDPTELKILNSRNQPNAVAARAIVRNATGYKYWEHFSEDGKKEVENLGRGINKALYSPPLNPPIRTADLPIAGHGYGSQTLPLIFDFVNIASDLPVSDKSKGKAKIIEKARPDESKTLAVMRSTDRLARRLSGTHASSLGLHPAVYFYAANGRHQPTAVLAVAALIQKISRTNSLNEFTRVRAKFEDFLLEHKMFVNQLTTAYGSMAKGYRQISDYMEYVLNLFISGLESDQILLNLRDHDRYQRLVKEKPVRSSKAKEFSQDLKQFVFLKQTLESSFVCSICDARVDNKAMTLDHVKEKRDGGIAIAENAKWVHPYCNSTYKDFLAKG
ncbi:MAG: DUF262 domain-containing protein [Rhodanobacteraceae bacterium]|nr:DUF262 domain-containing protein [Rhodanobacteraceae bacterium]